MATFKAPKPGKKSTKGQPPALPSSTLNSPVNSDARVWATITFKVDPEFKKDFARYCLEHDKSMVDMFKEALALHREHSSL